MHKSATKCNETVGKWCKNKHGASKIIDTLETYHATVICLPSMLLFILWRDTTSELWTMLQFLYIAITVLLLLALFTFLHTITFYHSIRLILYLQQTGEIDNLIVSWGKVLGCVVCRFHVAASEKPRTSIYLAPFSGVSQS
jgi:hypothetical protein